MSAVVAREGLGEPAAPAFKLPKGGFVEIGARGSDTLRRMVVLRRWPRRGTTASTVQFEDETGAATFLSDEQIAHLCRADEFRLVSDASGEIFAPPPPLIDLTKEQVAECERRKAYVDAHFGEPRPGVRSRPVLNLKIEAVASGRGEKTPSFQTVLDWADLWADRGERFGLPCLHFPPNPGNRRSKLSSPLIEEALRKGIWHAVRTPKGTAKDALLFAKAWLKENRPHVDGEAMTWPDVRTVQTRIGGLNKYERDAFRFGVGRGGRKHRLSAETKRPDLPLEEVECDHTPADILVVDEEKRIIFGRPDLIGFRDRCTGAILGLSISFEAPSYASFMNGLRHAMFRKDMSEYPTLRGWPMFGRPKRLLVDNAFHFTGHNIAAAEATLGFEVNEFLPGEPCLKGGLERLWRTVSTNVHKLDGSTFSNADERKKYQELAGRPTVTMSELRAFITRWIVEDYNPEPHEGLGFLRTLKDIPERLWNEKIEKVGLATLPAETDFIALAGDADWKAINGKGVRWDNIRYGSSELKAIFTAGKHSKGVTDPDWGGTTHQGERYLIRRDPFDLGHIYVKNPYDASHTLKVPAYRMDYAGGLTLHQHRVIQAKAEGDLRSSSDPEQILLLERKRVDRYAVMLLEDRKIAGTGKILARYLEDGGRRRTRSEVRNVPLSPALSRNPVDPRNPDGLRPPAPGSRDTAQPTRSGPAPEETEAEPFAFDQDLPRRIDRGENVAAAIAKRARGSDRATNIDTAHVAMGADTAEERRRQRLEEGWDDGAADSAPPPCDIGQGRETLDAVETGGRPNETDTLADQATAPSLGTDADGPASPTDSVTAEAAPPRARRRARANYDDLAKPRPPAKAAAVDVRLASGETDAPAKTTAKPVERPSTHPASEPAPTLDPEAEERRRRRLAEGWGE